MNRRAYRKGEALALVFTSSDGFSDPTPATRTVTVTSGITNPSPPPPGGGGSPGSGTSSSGGGGGLGLPALFVLLLFALLAWREGRERSEG